MTFKIYHDAIIRTRKSQFFSVDDLKKIKVVIDKLVIQNRIAQNYFIK